MREVRVETCAGIASLFFAFDEDAKDELKRTVATSWNKCRRCWEVPVWELDQALRVLRRYGFAESGTSEARMPRARAVAGDPFEALLLELPERLREPAFRALAKVLHPDIGGDHEAMQRLTTAWRRAA